MTSQNIFQFISVLCSGLVAGLLFGYSCSVNIGFKSLGDSEYVRAMQSINEAIQNRSFLSVFLGLLVIFPFTTYLQFKEMAHASFYFIFTATLLYVVGVFGVTMLYNVPLNEQLAKFNPATASANEMATIRQSFEKPWNIYHSVRTVASIISFGLTIISLFKTKL